MQLILEISNHFIETVIILFIYMYFSMDHIITRMLICQTHNDIRYTDIIYVTCHFKTFGCFKTAKAVSKGRNDLDGHFKTISCVFSTDFNVCKCYKFVPTLINNCIPGVKWGYYGFIIFVVRVRRDFLLATYSPHFFPDFFHIWQVA